MSTRSLQPIIDIILSLIDHKDVDGDVNIESGKKVTTLKIDFDKRKYIGRMKLVWKRDHYDVYLTDKVTGKIKASKLPFSKSVYFRIETAADARKFVKMYILITQLAALRRTRR